ncbi:hypothetical protein SASPL_130999 [Salvia splendens]|uniref:Uncharacterized protein n=1 Tax=Salvia splendens TaxID=180675 RepID=A0A8X8ZK72_SALSN|nr:hypothetical protein SASPL_130999 [Salvia splendens]
MEGSPHLNQVPSEPAVKRFRILWRVFLLFNFGLGGEIKVNDYACIVLLAAASIPRVSEKQIGDVSGISDVKECLEDHLVLRRRLRYMFAQGGKKERAEKKAIEEPPPAPLTTVSAPAQEEPIIVTPHVERPVPVRPPVPEDQQREIFKWILEEKRKVKPQNRQEKKRIDEEKAILKEFIRSETVPKI